MEKFRLNKGCGQNIICRKCPVYNVCNNRRTSYFLGLPGGVGASLNTLMDIEKTAFIEYNKIQKWKTLK
jgi:hypothetical protein